MELGPKIRGKKVKSIRVDPTDLALLRKELKANPAWAEYAEASDSEVHRIAVIFARVHVAPDVHVLTTKALCELLNEAIRINVAAVAQALGGVAQANQDGTISVTRPESDGITTLRIEPPEPPPPTRVN